MRVSVLVRLIVYMVIAGACWVPAAMSGTADNTGLETTVRALVRANAEKDLPTMSKLMAHDADITSYSIGGRKYVGWPDLERDIKEEFAKWLPSIFASQNSRCGRREILGGIQWNWTMGVSSIRDRTSREPACRYEKPVCLNVETASGSSCPGMNPSAMPAARCLSMIVRTAAAPRTVASSVGQPVVPDLSGEWDILEVEDDKHYKATLDKAGNGPYTPARWTIRHHEVRRPSLARHLATARQRSRRRI